MFWGLSKIKAGRQIIDSAPFQISKLVKDRHGTVAMKWVHKQDTFRVDAHSGRDIFKHVNIKALRYVTGSTPTGLSLRVLCLILLSEVDVQNPSVS